MLTCTVGLTALDATAKLASATFPVAGIAWARFAIPALAMAAAGGPHLIRDTIAAPHRLLQIVRALLLVASNLTFFEAIRALPLAETTAITFVSPMILVLLSAGFLGEPAVARRWIAVALSFGGVLLIARPGGAISPANAILPLATAVLFAFYQALTSRVGPTTRPMVTLFYTVIVGSVVMTAVALPTWRMPDGHEAALLLAVGALGFAAHLALIHAFTIAPASLLATFDYSRLVWATLAGALLFGTIPDALSAVGMGCPLGCGLALFGWEWRAARSPRSRQE
jgi:drug/metabolite transporter (DMT)-like permease